MGGRTASWATLPDSNVSRRRWHGACRERNTPCPPGVAPGGHGGSHGYLADDFIDAILRAQTAVGVIDALNMTVPGYYAHLSAVKDGETLKIPRYS